MPILIFALAISTRSLWSGSWNGRGSELRLPLPRLYAILDGTTVRSAGLDVIAAATELRDAGVGLLQYRDKQVGPMEILANARAIAEIFAGSATLLLNDHADLVERAGWDGVHVGQGDAGVAEVRAMLGPERVIGVSTHTPEQFRAALLTDADYLAFGPVFQTTTKSDAEDVVGLHGLKQIRAMTDRPVVAIGGISHERVADVLMAGADSVAVIGALFGGGRTVTENALELIRVSGATG